EPREARKTLRAWGYGQTWRGASQYRLLSSDSARAMWVCGKGLLDEPLTPGADAGLCAGCSAHLLQHVGHVLAYRAVPDAEDEADLFIRLAGQDHLEHGDLPEAEAV